MGNKSLQRAAKTLLAYLDANSGSNPAYHDAAIYIRILQAENERLRQIISDSATACGAAMSTKCTVEFMGHLPAEIAGVLRLLRAELERARASLREVSAIVDGNIREIVRDLVNRDAGLNNGANPNDIYAECDRIDTEIDAAMGKGWRADG